MTPRRLITATAVVAALVLTPSAALAQTDATTTTAPERKPRPPREAPPREAPPREAPPRERPPARDDSVDGMKQRCLHQVDRRLRALAEEDRRLDNVGALTAAHRAALKAINAEVSSGLSSLADEIQAEDNAEELRAECRRIVTDFRVFVLVRPRARLVIASDRALAAATRLTGVADRIQEAIDDAKADGRDTAEAEAHLAAMQAAIGDAQNHASGVYEAVIHLTAADYNANSDVLDPARRSTRAAREELRTAVAEGRAARDALKSSAEQPAA